MKQDAQSYFTANGAGLISDPIKSPETTGPTIDFVCRPAAVSLEQLLPDINLENRV